METQKKKKKKKNEGFTDTILKFFSSIKHLSKTVWNGKIL